ncbi:MAG: hypothetical protein A2W19_11740 [Spirochaetes bacterium RBG_16_49_21]|nr:MAG: hypothetical protein A2W19_11740 [Spirochaetes bacterium RBG_16_49_21]
MQSLTEKRRQLEAEIAVVRAQIAKARELGQDIDALTLQLAILRSDLVICRGCFMPPSWNRTHNIYC